MRRWGLLVAGMALILLALIVLVAAIPGLRGRRAPSPSMGPMMGRPPGARAPSSFQSNGERIYHTATSRSGEAITFTGGPPWLHMHGGSCANCHGVGGRGGIVVPMTDQVAPDIRYSALTSAEHAEHPGEEHPRYTDALIKRAITRGLDPAGEPLDSAMPRWRMSERDLSDLLAYLKTLDGR